MRGRLRRNPQDADGEAVAGSGPADGAAVSGSPAAGCHIILSRLPDAIMAVLFAA